jgi:hypothetical protein
MAKEAYIVVITVWAVLVTVLVHAHVLPERLLALLADECHLHRLRERMVLRLCVAFGAVEPLLAARRSDADLSVEDVLASRKRVSSTI